MDGSFGLLNQRQLKIAVFSLPLNYNVGGMLQQFALSFALRKLGATPFLISRRKTRSGVLNLVVQSKWALLSSFPFPRLLAKFSLLFAAESFKRKFLYNRLPDVYSSDELRRLLDNNNFEAVVVGSDQVWNPLASPCLLDHFLYNLHSPRRFALAYAASFGSLSFPISEKEILLARSSLSNFKLVSLRESSGVAFAKETFLVNAHKVVDPTVLLSPDEYSDIFKLSNLGHYLPTRFIFVYVLDMNGPILRSLSEIGARMELPLVFFSSSHRRRYRKSELRNPAKTYEMQAMSPENWLFGIAKATIVLTDSFHGTLLSCLFNTSFLCYGNAKRGNDRFESLLSELNLQDRYHPLPETVEDFHLSLKHDWSDVNRYFASQRHLSLSLLAGALELSS